MPRHDLTLAQLVALNLRLAQSVVVAAGSGSERRTSRLGLKPWLERHANGTCLCRDKNPPPLQIDFHGEVTDREHPEKEHPEDYLRGCPALYHEPQLLEQVYAAIALEDLGGLAVYSGRAPADLPWRVVSFWQLALGARDRFVAERDAAQAKLVSR